VEHEFARARVLVTTSEVEGFPNVLIEAWKTATPVASLRIDPDGLIRQHGAGFVADDDEDALARGVERLLVDDDLFEQSAANAYALAKQVADIGCTIEQYKRILASSAGRRGR
jgi:glycosyltransferase involved in cell wall biosynthesis